MPNGLGSFFQQPIRTSQPTMSLPSAAASPSSVPSISSITLSYIAADVVTGRVLSGDDDDIHRAPSSYNAFLPSLPSLPTPSTSEASLIAAGVHEPYRSSTGSSDGSDPFINDAIASAAAAAAALSHDQDSYSDRTDYEGSYQR